MTSPTASFRSRLLHADRPLPGAFLNLGSSLTAEIMALGGFEWLGIDLEHGAGGELEALQQLQAIAHTGVAGFVRLESASGARIAHALDAGAIGVIVPQIDSTEEAEEAASLCRYAGKRGVARFNRAWQWGARTGALSTADDEVVCCIQIERAGALDDVDGIAALPGVDVVFVGPADLAHNLGISGAADDPAVLEAAERVALAARAHGKVAGVLAGDVRQLAAYARLGFTFLGCAADSALLMRAARATAAELRELPLG
jgi:2-keto-3-deoxy-L-rhamnonate aldolase RhmA